MTGSKAGLAAAVYDEAIRRYQQPMLAVVERNPRAEDGIRSLVEAHHHWVATNSDWARFMMMHGDLVEIRAHAAAHRETNIRLVVALMAWAEPLMEKRQLVPLDSASFLAAVFGPSYFHTRISLSGSPQPPDADVGSALAGVVWSGLQGPAEPERRAL